MSAQVKQRDTGHYALALLAVDAAFYQGEEEEKGHILLFNPRDGRWHCDCGPDAPARDQACPHLRALYAFLAEGL